MRRLRILWLSHFIPYPPKGGAFQRSFNLIRGVGEAHELHLIALRHKTSTHPAAETQNARQELGRTCESIALIDGTSATAPFGLAMRALKLGIGVPLTVSVSDLTAMRAAIRSAVLSHRFDVVHFDTIGLACYLKDVAGIPAVLSHHGAESFMMLRRTKREPSLPKRLLYLIEGHLLRRYEARYCPRFADNIVVSELDAKLLSETAATARFTVVPNGVDTTYYYSMQPAAGNRVVFAGRLDQYSNRDAILHFSTEIWPRIRATFSNARLDVLGANPPKDLVLLAERDPSIRVHGFVDDVRPYFESAAVAVCPIRDGGGTRVKILDNLAMGKPIVSTTIGIEGINVTPERDLLVADTPTDFALQVGRIFTDAALRARLSASAREVAVTQYSWESILASLNGAYQAAAEPGLVPTDT